MKLNSYQVWQLLKLDNRSFTHTWYKQQQGLVDLELTRAVVTHVRAVVRGITFTFIKRRWSTASVILSVLTIHYKTDWHFVRQNVMFQLYRNISHEHSSLMKEKTFENLVNNWGQRYIKTTTKKQNRLLLF